MEWLTPLLEQLNYGSVFFLMLLESTVIPVPSEFVVVPAAYNAAAGQLNIWLVILFSTLGANAGASLNYWAGYFLGRPVIYKFANSKWGKMCLLNQEKVEKTEKYFDSHGKTATVTGRLIPGIRHLISIPAGLAKMNYWKFLLYTTIGATAWHAILAGMGYYFHSIVPANQLNEKIMEYGDYLKFIILGIVALAILFFIIKWKITNKK